MDREARVAAIFREALDHPPELRAARVAAACGADAELAAEVAALLRDVAATASPLDRRAAERGIPAAPVEASVPPARIGPFRVIRRLGRGGMGEVWLAERTAGGFAQTVALKWVDRTRLGAEGLARFARERDLLARIDHPGIARLVDGGECDGTPWFAMEFVEGETIDEYVVRQRLDLAATIALFLPVADAVQHLHRNLIVHRDLKPSNVLVDRSGRPRLIDFGIARPLDETAALTAALAPMSLAYAAPEQVTGAPITVATDVYGLGALLHELLCGQSPHAAAASSLPRLVDAIARGVPPPVSAALAAGGAWRPWRPAALRGDLDLIVATCLRREPERRYASAAALADDLRRWRQRQPVAARPDSALYRVQRFVARHPLGVALGAVAAAALAASSAWAIQAADRARAAALVAARERDLAREEARRQEALREHFAAVIGRATARTEPIAPATLLDLVADPDAGTPISDPGTRRALVLALADALVIRADFQRLARLLETAAPAMAAAGAREQAEFHKHRAVAGIRLGDERLAEDGIEQAAAAIERAGLGDTLIAAEVLGYRAQRARLQGDLGRAVEWSAAAARIARRDAAASALDRGTVLANHAVTLLQAGHPEAASAAVDEAEAIWAAGGVSANASAASARAVRANARLAAGDPAAALAAFEAIEADAPAGDPEPAKASRQLARARALAWLGRPGEAAAEADAAVARMCAALGADSGDCRRMQAGRVDVLAVAGQAAAALAAAGNLGDAAAPAPSVALGRALAAYQAGDGGAAAAIVAAASNVSAQDRAGARHAARIALLAARHARRSGSPAEARRLVDAAAIALDRAGASGGFERPWLAFERARGGDGVVPPTVLEALQRLGLGHLAE